MIYNENIIFMFIIISIFCIVNIISITIKRLQLLIYFKISSIINIHSIQFSIFIILLCNICNVSRYINNEQDDSMI